MASPRGMRNQERFGLEMATVTADASLVTAPCYLYSMVCGLIDVSATGSVVIADSSASGTETDKETDKIEVKLGAGAVSASSWSGNFQQVFNPPVFISQTLVADITNATVSVTYFPA